MLTLAYEHHDLAVCRNEQSLALLRKSKGKKKAVLNQVTARQRTILAGCRGTRAWLLETLSCQPRGVGGPSGLSGHWAWRGPLAPFPSPVTEMFPSWDQHCSVLKTIRCTCFFYFPLEGRAQASRFFVTPSEPNAMP